MGISVTGTTATYQIANLHGDIVATQTHQSGALTIDTYNETDEFGNPITGPTSRYGWLGTHQRSTDAVGGLTLMGVRLYNPTTGTFLSPDPVLGANATSYTYPQDPINFDDIDGKCPRPLVYCSRVKDGIKAPNGLMWGLRNLSSNEIGRLGEDHAVFFARRLMARDIHRGSSGRNRHTVRYRDGSTQLRIYDISFKLGNVIFFVEVKANGSRYHAHQRRADDRMRQLGFNILFWRFIGIATTKWILYDPLIA